MTNATRSTIRTILANSANYDASTMRISRDGMVTALKDADKIFAGDDGTRYNVGFVTDMLEGGC